MNNIDYKVIAQLIQNGRITWAELGAYLGVTAPAAAERVRKLEERGVIQGYTALIQPQSLGYDLTAFISVSLSHPTYRQVFLENVQKHPLILECHHMAGDYDYLLKVRCRTILELETMVSEDLKSVPGVEKTKTAIALSSVKETPLLPPPGEE